MSYAGNEDRRSVNATYVQPFITYATKTKTTFALNAESTYDWNISQWTVPLNLSVSQLVKIGNLPVQFAVGGRYYAKGPSGAPEWGVRLSPPVFPALPLQSKWGNVGGRRVSVLCKYSTFFASGWSRGCKR